MENIKNPNKAITTDLYPVYLAGRSIPLTVGYIQAGQYIDYCSVKDKGSIRDVRIDLKSQMVMT